MQTDADVSGVSGRQGGEAAGSTHVPGSVDGLDGADRLDGLDGLDGAERTAAVERLGADAVPGSEGLAGEAGVVTAEYAIATLAAAAFAGVLLVILRSGEVRAFLLGIIRQALSV